MTTTDLLKRQTTDAGKMLAKAFEGIEERDADTRLEPMMSAREQANHLTECYIAAKKYCAGEKHDWGTYAPSAESLDQQLAEMFARRDEAVATLLALEDSAQAEHEGFLVGHDHYHVGQMAILHLTIDPAWDPYCIYT